MLLCLGLYSKKNKHLKQTSFLYNFPIADLFANSIKKKNLFLLFIFLSYSSFPPNFFFSLILLLFNIIPFNPLIFNNYYELFRILFLILQYHYWLGASLYVLFSCSLFFYLEHLILRWLPWLTGWFNYSLDISICDTMGITAFTWPLNELTPPP